MVHRIRERARNPGNTNLADAAYADGIEVLVVLVDEGDVDLADVGVHGNMVVGEIAVDESPVAAIEHAFLEQRLTHPPDDTALKLAACHLRIEKPSDAVRCDDARDADHAERKIDADLGENRTERA